MTRQTSIRIPDSLYARILQRAQAEQRTVSNMIVVLLNRGLNVATNVADATEDNKKRAD